MADFQCNAVLICDDVRKEISNKEILIGVYSGNIHVPTLPAALLLSFWLEMTSKRKGPFEMTLRIQLPNPDQKFEYRINGEVPEAKVPFSVFTPQGSFVIEREGEIKIFGKLPGSERFDLLKSKTVKYLPLSALVQNQKE
jgi:hypothetical protein